MSNTEKIENLLVDPKVGFLINLRFGKGIDYQKVNEIKQTLDDIKTEWKDSLLIPKSVCGVFMDFYIGVEGCLSLYDNQEQQDILNIADDIMDCMRDCIY